MSTFPYASSDELAPHGALCSQNWNLVEHAYRRGLVQGMLDHVVVLADLSDPIARHLAERFGLRAGEIRRKREHARQRGTDPVWATPLDLAEAREGLRQLAPYAAEGLDDRLPGEKFHVVVACHGVVCIASVAGGQDCN